MFDLEKFKTGKYYVHLPTREVYNKAMEYLDENGFKWNGGGYITDNTICRWDAFRQQTCISYEKHRHSEGVEFTDLDYYKEEGYTQLEINKLETGGISMNEKMKRDLIKLLFEKEFSSYDLTNMYEYKGRIITGYLHRDITLIDFIEKVENEYGFNAYETLDIVIEEFDIEKYKENI